MSKNGKKKAVKRNAETIEMFANQAIEIAGLNKCNEYLSQRLSAADDRNVSLSGKLANAETLRTAMYRGFAQERDEKYAEIYRLENRMRALGFELPDDRKAGV